MLSVFLKRILPFVLTLIAGLALGGFTNIFRAQHRSQTTTARAVLVGRGEHRSCANRRDFDFNGGGAGRLVSIQRQTEDGSWVATRPVGPEVYELTTRPAIIRAPRPNAEYTQAARAHNVTGTVVLEATLSPSGRVTDIEPRWQLPEELTLQAVMAAERIQFEPALKEGRPVSQRIMLEYNFGL